MENDFVPDFAKTVAGPVHRCYFKTFFFKNLQEHNIIPSSLAQMTIRRNINKNFKNI